MSAPLTFKAEDFFSWLIDQAKTPSDGPVYAMAQGYLGAANNGKFPFTGDTTPKQFAHAYAASAQHSGEKLPPEAIAAAYWAALGTAETYARMKRAR